MSRLAAMALAALCLTACNRGGTQVFLPELEQSGRIDLFCADIQDADDIRTAVFISLLPLVACTVDEDQLAEGFEPNALGPTTQTLRGEVVTVNITEGTVFDTLEASPGATGVLVAEQPTAIQVSGVNPDFVWVSSFSGRRLQGFPSPQIIGVPEDPDDPYPVIEPVELDFGAADLVLYEFVTGQPDEQNEDPDDPAIVTGYTLGTTGDRWLFAALPDSGQILPVRWEGEAFEPGTPITLPTRTCADVTPVAPSPDTENDYNRICPEAEQPIARVVKQVDTTITCLDGPAEGARPVRLHIDDGGTPDDASDDMLLVADANQPVIHRFELGTDGIVAEADPIVTGAPTSAVVTTPFVPASFDNELATQRYLYAISIVDDSVLAVDYTPNDEEGNGQFGAVVPVIAGVDVRANEEGVEGRNRVRSSFANARAIEVVTPDYELEDDDGVLEVPQSSLCGRIGNDVDEATAQNPREMRGVFVAVSLSEGNLFFIDVYDLNAPCRAVSGTNDCNSEDSVDAFASIRRHRRRLNAPPSEFIEIEGTPALVFNASQGTLDPDTGTAQNSDGPGLEFLQCPDALEEVFGPEPPTQELICSSTQVWSTLIQRWDATWEGTIPNSQGGLGRFATEPSNSDLENTTGRWLIAGDVPFCEVGVLGEGIELPGYPELAADAPPNTEYSGDRLLITGPLPNIASSEDPECESLFDDIEDEIEDFPVWFPIVRAFNNELELGPSPNPSRYTFEQVLACFTGFTEYEIRTRNSYAVVGTFTGFAHRVIPAGEDVVNEEVALNQCILDTARPIGCNRDPDSNEVLTGPFLQECSTPGVTDVLDVDTILTARAFPEVQYINPLVSFEIGPFQEDSQPTDATIAILTFSIFNGFTELLQPTGGNAPSLPSSMLFSPTLDELFFVDFQNGVLQLRFDPLSTVDTF